jgi:hypothetical protein
MGMFDWYEPNPPLNCPVCDAKLDGWQSQDANCALFVFRQGERHPIYQDVPDEMKRTLLGDVQLPEEFTIYTNCCGNGFLVLAKCRALNGVWSETELITAQNVQQGKQRKSDFNAYLRWLEGKKL